MTEFTSTPRRPTSPTRKSELKFVKATADVNPPEPPLEPIFDDQRGRRRVTGPIDYAIDGKDETAWGIDAGPGRRNLPRNAVFVLDKPVAFPAGVILTFKLVQNHGGWNSDDNQNNNLGRFRFCHHRSGRPQADLVPRPVREILAIPRERRTAAQENAVFSYWRTTVPSGRLPTIRSRPSGSNTRRARRSSCSRIATSPGRLTSSSAATSSSRARW